ncbi:hypothetical protein ACIBG4_16130 [Nonomuraea sp. NPDC050383]|uniref:hypothetical protein n=1 Tax=Nonomuraea sp. NPDC050383 TaxID=3364362 RepID=UPI00378F324E
MGWDQGDGLHEGWAAAVSPDGRVSSGSRNGGALVATVGQGGRVGYAADVLDGRTAVGWRGHCDCGWQGPLGERVATADEMNTTDRKVWWPDLDQYGDPPAGVEDGIRAEWVAHLDRPSIVAVREAAQAVRDAEARLAGGVRAAREDGRSWSRIGEAAGMAKQSAHERWGGRFSG